MAKTRRKQRSRVGRRSKRSRRSRGAIRSKVGRRSRVGRRSKRTSRLNRSRRNIIKRRSTMKGGAKPATVGEMIQLMKSVPPGKNAEVWKASINEEESWWNSKDAAWQEENHDEVLNRMFSEWSEEMNK